MLIPAPTPVHLWGWGDGSRLLQPGSPVTLPLIELRHELHRQAELSGREERTAARIVDVLRRTNPAKIVTGLGGHGVAGVYDSGVNGPEILLRADLDALPIPERIAPAYASQTSGVAHKCGHDGHMTLLAGVALKLAQQPPRRGRVVLLFQPAEETGQGAALVLADQAFGEFKPDKVFALHNLPGYETGAVILREGHFATASKGLIIELEGATAHAAQPERGNSPALAMADLIQALSALPQTTAALHEAVKVTIIHVKVGEIAFGTTPGAAQVMATLRAYDGDVLTRIGQQAERLARGVASTHELDVTIRWTEEFPETFNDATAAGQVHEAATTLSRPLVEPAHPFPWSEDFGHFTRAYPGALFGLGSGIEQPPLHHPTYDFPDEILEPGVELWLEVLRQAGVLE